MAHKIVNQDFFKPRAKLDLIPSNLNPQSAFKPRTKSRAHAPEKFPFNFQNNNELPPSLLAAPKLLSTQRGLLDTIQSFLTVVTHHLLAIRNVYPPVSFQRVRAYNYPAHQSRHPEVVDWINDAIAAVRDSLNKNIVERMAVCIFEEDDNTVLERWVFDLSELPNIIKQHQDVSFNAVRDQPLRREIRVADVEASFRAVLSRLDTVSNKLRPLPDGKSAPGCSFTLTIEVKDRQAPINRSNRYDQQWIVAEADPQMPIDLQKTEKGMLMREMQLGNTHPVRRMDAGELHLEVYVEESKRKFELPSSFKTTLEKAANLSYGAGTEKFNPVHGYDDDEGADIFKRPAPGMAACT